jgi:hypothetical protein
LIKRLQHKKKCDLKRARHLHHLLSLFLDRAVCFFLFFGFPKSPSNSRNQCTQIYIKKKSYTIKNDEISPIDFEKKNNNKNEIKLPTKKKRIKEELGD